jgi:hypothetical protein
MRKRTWMYVMKPFEYEIQCDKCGGSNIEWSEFEHKIWCYDCKIDTDGTEGVFGGPIGWGVAELIGLSFNKWDMKKNCLTYPRIVGHKIKWFVKKSE